MTQGYGNHESPDATKAQKGSATGRKPAAPDADRPASGERDVATPGEGATPPPEPKSGDEADPGVG